MANERPAEGKTGAALGVDQPVVKPPPTRNPRPGPIRRITRVLFILFLIGFGVWVLIDLDRRAGEMAHASMHLSSGFAPPPVTVPTGIAVPGGFTDAYPTNSRSFNVQVTSPMNVGSPEVRVFRDRQICGDTVWPYTSGGGPTGVPDALVWIEGISSGMANYSTAVSLSNGGCSLWPHVSVAGVGSTLTVENYLYAPEVLRVTLLDAGQQTVLEHVSLEAMNTVNYTAVSHTLTLEKPGLVRIQSMLRPWEIAFVLVCEHGYCGVTDWEGKFYASSVPDGTYTVHAWHHLSGEITAPLTVHAGVEAQDVPLTYP